MAFAYMSVWFRLRPTFAALTLAFTSQTGQAAWFETRVKAHTATVDVERDGSAEVRHELVLGVRGGPVRDFEIQGVDPDAEPIGEATATPIVRYGIPAAIPLVLSRGEDGTLRIEIQNEKGLRTGSYTFAFRYKTDLLGRDRIRRRGTSAELEWVGPRFADGVDVAKLVLRLPIGPVAPVIPNGLEGDDASVMGSAFLSSVRHESGKVEMEIVRPHVARGEPAVWRVLTSPKCFDGLPEPAARIAAANSRILAIERPGERVVGISAVVAVALVFGLLLLLKWSLHGSDCRAVRAEPVPLLRLPIGARAALAGALLAAATALGALGDHPTTAAVLLLASMATAALRAPKLGVSPRGPGQWLALTDQDAFSARPSRARGRFLDMGTWPGASLFVLLTGALTFVSSRLAPHSPYHALALVLSAAVLLPVFGTGRLSSLPIDRARAPQKFLLKLAVRLRARSGLKAVAWARIPDGSHQPDELRLLLRVPRAKDGLHNIEIGLEHQASPAGFIAMPFAIVRVREDSEAHAALPRSVVWHRGRRADERVAIVRPSLPTVHLCAALVSELVTQLSAPDRSSSKKTRGVSSVTAKASVRSPAHAM